MKNKAPAILFALVAVFVFSAGIGPLWGQEKAKKESQLKVESGLAILRAVIGTGVDNREPVGVSAVLPAATEKAYCFLEAANIPRDMEISLAWFYGQKEMRRMSLPLKAGSRWRTFAHKNLNGLKGDWKVEIKDGEGKLLKDLAFKVE